MLVQGFLDRLFRHVADDLLSDLAALEHQQRRDTAHVVALRRSDVLVDVHLRNFHLALVLAGDFVRSKEVFVLEVRGESMQDEAILNGDYVLVEKTKTAHNGDIVVALVDTSDTTLKRFYHEGDKIRLQPSNAAMQPIIVAAASVEIQGRVIGVLRK